MGHVREGRGVRETETQMRKGGRGKQRETEGLGRGDGETERGPRDGGTETQRDGGWAQGQGINDQVGVRAGEQKQHWNINANIQVGRGLVFPEVSHESSRCRKTPSSTVVISVHN